MSTVDENNNIFNQKYFASSVRKEPRGADAFIYVKTYVQVWKLLKSTFLDKSPQKWNIFAPNLQSSLSFTEITPDKTENSSLKSFFKSE